MSDPATLRLALLAAATLAAPACLIVPKTVRTDRTLNTYWTAPAPASSRRGVLLAVAHTEGRVVRVAITEGRTCIQQQVRVIETTTHTTKALDPGLVPGLPRHLCR